MPLRHALKLEAIKRRCGWLDRRRHGGGVVSQCWVCWGISRSGWTTTMSSNKTAATPLSVSYPVNSVEVASSEEGGAEEQAMPLANVTNKSLEDKEKRAIRLAEESFGHINQKATPEGQAVFDRLLKACNEVVWRGESIIVLNQIRVNPPYGKEDCKLLSSTGGATGALHEGSLDRVKKIVAVDATDRS
eukprot:scaffold150026_cov62-Attheya_sp.AAC.2